MTRPYNRKKVKTMNSDQNVEKVRELISLVDAAVKVGSVDRAAVAVSPNFAERHKTDASRVRLATVVRVASVIGDLPAKVQHAVAMAKLDAKTVSVPVMELTHAEYPGPEKRSDYTMPVSTLSVDKLKHAGAKVFELLHSTSYSPRLDYLYDGTTRTYTLQICITVQPRNFVMDLWGIFPTEK
jgi:hypothetical protein